MHIINTIPHGKCFVRYLRSRCFCIRNLTRLLRSLVRFLIRQQLVCKYRTPALAMKYSLCIAPPPLNGMVHCSLSQVFPPAVQHVCHLLEGIPNVAKLLFQERKTIAKLNLQDLQILSLRYSPTMSPLCFKDPNKFTGCHFIHNTFPTHCLPFKEFFLSAYLSIGMAENNYVA